MNASSHINTIDSRIFDSKVSLILFFDQSSFHQKIFLAKLQMLHVLFCLWLTFVRFVNDFDILLKDFLLRLKICFDSSHDWESSFCRSQMTNSSFATNSKNRTHIDLSAHRTNSIASSSHRFSLNSTIIDSIADVWALSADLCIFESSRVFKLDSWRRDVSSMSIIFDESFFDFWDKSNLIDQLTSIWKCSDFSEHRFVFYIYAFSFYSFLAKSRDHVAFRSTARLNWSHRILSWKK